MSRNKNRSVIVKMPKKDTNFTTIENEMINFKEISYKATGIYAVLCSLPPNWQIYVHDLIKRKTDGRDSVQSGLKELQNKGFINRYPIRNEKGQIDHWRFEFYERPEWNLTSDEPETENPVEGGNKGLSPETDFPDVDNPDVGNPHYNNKEKDLNNKDLNNKESGEGSPPENENDSNEKDEKTKPSFKEEADASLSQDQTNMMSEQASLQESNIMLKEEDTQSVAEPSRDGFQSFKEEEPKGSETKTNKMIDGIQSLGSHYKFNSKEKASFVNLFEQDKGTSFMSDLIPNLIDLKGKKHNGITASSLLKVIVLYFKTFEQLPNEKEVANFERLLAEKPITPARLKPFIVSCKENANKEQFQADFEVLKQNFWIYTKNGVMPSANVSGPLARETTQRNVFAEKVRRKSNVGNLDEFFK